MSAPVGAGQNQHGTSRTPSPTAGTEVSAKTVARLRNPQTGRRDAVPYSGNGRRAPRGEPVRFRLIVYPGGIVGTAGGASPSPTGWCETNTGRRGRRPLRRRPTSPRSRLPFRVSHAGRGKPLPYSAQSGKPPPLRRKRTARNPQGQFTNRPPHRAAQPIPFRASHAGTSRTPSPTAKNRISTHIFSSTERRYL